MINIFLQIIFWGSFYCLFHSYVLYPLIMKVWAKGKKINPNRYTKDSLPKVAIVMAAYNEESVIEEKLNSILASDYPKDLYTVYIGSDNSTDKTNEICSDFAKKHTNIHFFPLDGRNGKSGVLNRLFKNHITKEDFEAIIMTDANVMFTENTIEELAIHFKNEAIGLVCANIENIRVKNVGIAKQEQLYISKENQLKINEGIAFGASMGAFGACYAIRPAFIIEIPSNFLMEDFYISMNVLAQGKQIITNPEAIGLEDLPDDIEEEYKRKRRISAGNFQNLAVYYSLLFKKASIGFAFLSHKVLRWLGPFFLIAAYISLASLLPNPLYWKLLVFANLLLFLAFLDYALMRLNIHVNLLRLLRYFFMMNIALFAGFIQYLKGIKTNVWTPTERNDG